MSSAASELGKKGAKKGGVARANTLTPTERSDIARQAVRARWAKAGRLKSDDPPDNTSIVNNDPERVADQMPFSLLRGTLQFGDVALECHVLNDLRRVMTQGQVVRALTGGSDTSELQRYLRRNPLFDEGSFVGPISFRIPGVPTIAKGMEAVGLVEICDLYLEAAQRKLLRSSQMGIVRQAQIIVRACAKVGIIALIDEATGYEKVRAKRSLQLKLQAFIAEEMQDWAIMFPEDFWLELARLEGIRYSPRNRPLRWGKYVMMFVYDAIDGDVGRELRRKNPNPRFLRNHHQWLQKFGRDKVHDQITRVIAIMQLCNTMDEFRDKFARVFKKTAMQLRFDDLLAG